LYQWSAADPLKPKAGLSGAPSGTGAPRAFPFRRGEIDEGGGHFSPVAEFQGALAETASGDDGDGVGGAAVDFYEGDEALAVFAARVFDA
jgi:hypothetical protein